MSIFYFVFFCVYCTVVSFLIDVLFFGNPPDSSLNELESSI
jgi:hypothetical protein